MDFSTALQLLKADTVVNRLGWNGRGMFLALQKPDSHSKMSLPYIYMSTVQGDLVPWLASQTDLLAEDWVITQPHDMPSPVKPEYVEVVPPIGGYAQSFEAGYERAVSDTFGLGGDEACPAAASDAESVEDVPVAEVAKILDPAKDENSVENEGKILPYSGSF